MKSLSGRDFARIVERRGWTLLRVSGSHHIYGKSGSVAKNPRWTSGYLPLIRPLMMRQNIRLLNADAATLFRFNAE
jgi:hypothetical protein